LDNSHTTFLHLAEVGALVGKVGIGKRLTDGASKCTRESTAELQENGQKVVRKYHIQLLLDMPGSMCARRTEEKTVATRQCQLWLEHDPVATANGKYRARARS
jgi:hypothetical protein